MLLRYYSFIGVCIVSEAVPPDQHGGGPSEPQPAAQASDARVGEEDSASEDSQGSPGRRHQQQERQLQQGRGRGREEAGEVPDRQVRGAPVLYCTVLHCTVQCYQVRGAPDGAHQEAAQGGDVDIRPAAGALRDRGEQPHQQF